MNKLNLALLSALSISACSRGSSTKSTEDVTGQKSSELGFIKPEEIQPVKKLDLTKEEVIDWIRGEKPFEVQFSVKEKEEESTNVKSEMEKKFDECMNAQEKNILVKATKDTLSFDANMDLGKCFAETGTEKPKSPNERSNMNVRVFMLVSCDNEDFSRFNNMPISDVPKDFKPCLNSTTYSELTHNLAATDFLTTSVQTNGSESTSVLVESKSKRYKATSNAQGRPCASKKIGEEWAFENGCTEISRSVIEVHKLDGKDSGKADKEVFSRMEFDGVKMSANRKLRWYSAGKMKLTFGNWSGEAVYSDPNKEPTFKLSNGTESITEADIQFILSPKPVQKEPVLQPSEEIKKELQPSIQPGVSPEPPAKMAQPIAPIESPVKIVQPTLPTQPPVKTAPPAPMMLAEPSDEDLRKLILKKYGF